MATASDFGGGHSLIALFHLTTCLINDYLVIHILCNMLFVLAQSTAVCINLAKNKVQSSVH